MASRQVDAHIVGQARLRAFVVAAVEQAWNALLAYDRPNLDQWLSQVVPLVLAAQRASVALTGAYVANVLGRQPFGVNPDQLTGEALRGVSPREVYTRPFVTVWTALGNGTLWDDAVHSGLSRATSTAAMDVQMSSRATFQAVQNSDRGIRGYRRAADGDACDFCTLIDGAFVKSADAMPLHNHCGCSLEPVMDDVAVTPVPPSVAVRDHGELGPVLTDPGDSFTSQADF